MHGSKSSSDRQSKSKMGKLTRVHKEESNHGRHKNIVKDKRRSMPDAGDQVSTEESNEFKHRKSRTNEDSKGSTSSKLTTRNVLPTNKTRVKDIADNKTSGIIASVDKEHRRAKSRKDPEKPHMFINKDENNPSFRAHIVPSSNSMDVGGSNIDYTEESRGQVAVAESRNPETNGQNLQNESRSLSRNSQHSKVLCEGGHVDEYGSDFENTSTDMSEEAVDQCVHDSAGDLDKTSIVESSKSSFTVYTSHNIQTRSQQHDQQSSNSGFIDFNKVNAHKSMLGKLQRAKDLLRFIELDYDGTGHIFELKPVDEYSNYIMRFGSFNHNQVFVQTGDDALDTEVQTDPISMCKSGKWTQIPEMDFDSNDVEHDTEVSVESLAASDLRNSTYCSRPIPRSMLNSMKIMLALLREESLPDFSGLYLPEGNNTIETSDNNIISTQFTAEEINEYSSGICVACEFAPANGDKLLTIHRTEQDAEDATAADDRSFGPPCGHTVFVWSISTGNGSPDENLYCPGTTHMGSRNDNICCAAFSPDSLPSLVAAGLTDGSLCIWDLDDTPYEISMQSEISTRQKMYSKPPIYSTSGIKFKRLFNGQHDESSSETDQWKVTPIVQLKFLKAHDKNKFQILTLELDGVLSMWMVLYQSNSGGHTIYESLAGSQIDLGLRPAKNTMQMIRLFQVSVQPSARLPLTPCLLEDEAEQVDTNLEHLNGLEKPIATSLAVTNAGHILVGFSNGYIVHHPRCSGLRISPKNFYRPSNVLPVTALDVHPDNNFPLFLAGYTDGSICLFHLDFAYPIRHWFSTSSRSQIDSVTKVSWSFCHSSIFYTLTESGAVTEREMFDMKYKKTVDPITDPDEPKDVKVMDFALSPGLLGQINEETVIVSAFAFISKDSVKIHWLEPRKPANERVDNADIQNNLKDLIQTA